MSLNLSPHWLDTMIDASEKTESSAEELTADDVRNQLERIASSKGFAGAPRLCAFLRFVTEKVLAGEAQTISQYSIGIDVYHRNSAFDPKADPLVRIEAGRLRRALVRYYSDYGTGDSVLIEIPRGTYAPRFTPRAPVAPASNSAMTVGAALPTLEPPRIAVFPFKNESSTDDDYLSTGLGMELTSELCRHVGIEVVDFCTTNQFSDPGCDVRDTALSLAVDFVLYGRVRRSADRVGIDLRLMEVASAKQIWAERFTVAFEPSQLFEFEENIVSRIVGRIADTYGVIAREMTAKSAGRRVEQISSYEAVLRCFHYQLSLAEADHKRATLELKRAAELEPHSSLVWALLAQCTLDLAVFSYGSDPDALSTGVRFARRALSLDSSCQFAHYANCYASMVERDPETMIYSAERIVELNPKAPFMVGAAGFFLCLAGRYEKGMDLFEKSVELNPLFPSWLHGGPFFYHLKRGDLDRALLHARQFALPDFFWGEIMRASALGLMGRIKEADECARHLRELKPDFPQRAEEYVRFFVLDDELAEQIIGSLISLEPLTT